MIISRSPLRISLGGGGTDVSPYPETVGGAVISTTIDRYAYVTLNKNTNQTLRVNSQDYNLLETFNSISELHTKGKLDLVKSAFKYMKIKKTNLDVFLHVDAPPGSGLGSSSALTVALIGAMRYMQKKLIEPYDIAHTSYIVEREEAGISGGKQDQYASAFGGLNFIEFKKNTVIVNPLRLRPEIKNELIASLILSDTGIRRLSANIITRQIKSYKNKKKIVTDSLDSIKQLAYESKSHLLKWAVLILTDFLFCRSRNLFTQFAKLP